MVFESKTKDIHFFIYWTTKNSKIISIQRENAVYPVSPHSLIRPAINMIMIQLSLVSFS